jgi:hypothetical protein
MEFGMIAGDKKESTNYQTMDKQHSTATFIKTLAFSGLLLFMAHYSSAQQSLEVSFEPDQKYEIVINRMPSLSAELFGRDFVIGKEKEVGFEKWMIDESSWSHKQNISTMEFEFVPAEKELALEAWMTQTFKLEDRVVEEEDLAVEEWMLADTEWFEMN